MKERSALWDNLRGILIVTVVLSHFSETIINNGVMAGGARALFVFIEAFCMPIFIFVSGLFHRNRNIAQKVFAFIAFGFFYKFVVYVVCRLTAGKATFSLFTEGGAPWFMFALAVFVLLTYLLRDSDPRIILGISIGLACFVGYDKSIGNFLCLSRIIVFYPWYIAGTMANRIKLEALSKKKSLKFLGAAILLAWAALCVFALDKVYLLRPLLTGMNAYQKVHLPFPILFRVLCYCISAILVFAWILVMPSKNTFGLTVLGQRTMQIYFLHRPLLYIIVNLGLARTMIETLPGQLVWMLIAIAMTIILTWKPLSYPTDLFLHFRTPASKVQESPVGK
ncbi:MAG: acyltransferase family protein [Eubacteriales bacterium]|nr:acyltransferase family protein [Eubacteriales bacterium]